MPVELTEAETEYAVNVVKHIFDRHVVLQYNCTNTIPEQLLENVMACLEICIYFSVHLVLSSQIVLSTLGLCYCGFVRSG